MSIYNNMPYIVTTLFLLLSAIGAMFVLRKDLKKQDDDVKFNRQLEHTLNPNSELAEETSWLKEKLEILPNKMIEAKLVDPREYPVERLKRILAMLSAASFVILAFFTRTLFAGFVPIIFGSMAIFGLCMYKISKTRSLLDEQIPAFVSTFKANIQANQHSQNAMIRAIDNTASPLYDELEFAKSVMEAGDFKAGIIGMRKTVKNDTLRQMASCIELASNSGSSIENQLEIIEDIIADKQLLDRKKQLGVNENKPLFIVAGSFVPLSFFGSFFLSEMHRDFWFKSTISWIVLLGVLIAVLISSFATWKVIQKVEIG